ncbi:hypothetical protein [Dendronalium sp. ChiSLP03b]|uniref:hypothetical protein n=1 Tax=Dendronalium sp. ChiSLP03b TaxID=3075381 RepID=UPI00391DB6F2
MTRPENLPLYVYQLEANVALVLQGVAYKANNYSFNSITVKSNQPLRSGDCLENSCCFYGNKNLELLIHYQQKMPWYKVNAKLQNYYGCCIDRLTISFVDKDDLYVYCGRGVCTVFVELSDGNLSKQANELDDRYENLTTKELNQLDLLTQDWIASDSIEYWIKRVPEWNEIFTCIGEVPSNLIY